MSLLIKKKEEYLIMTVLQIIDLRAAELQDEEVADYDLAF